MNNCWLHRNIWANLYTSGLAMNNLVAVVQDDDSVVPPLDQLFLLIKGLPSCLRKEGYS